jgi:hypothetical protein
MYKYVTLFDREGSLWARWSRDDWATPPLFFEPLSRPPLGQPVMVDAAAFRAFWSDSARVSFDPAHARLGVDDAGARQYTRLACLYPDAPVEEGFTHVARIDDAAALHLATLSHDARWGAVAAYVRVGDGRARVWSTNRVALIRAITSGEGEASFVLRDVDVRALRALKGALDVFVRSYPPQRLRLASKTGVVEVELMKLPFPDFDAIIQPEPSAYADARELQRALKLARAGGRDDEARARFALTYDALTIHSDLASTSVAIQGDARLVVAPSCARELEGALKFTRVGGGQLQPRLRPQARAAAPGHGRDRHRRALSVAAAARRARRCFNRRGARLVVGAKMRGR